MAALALAPCGGRAPDSPPPTGLLLLDLRSGAIQGAQAIGQDPVAVALAPDGRTAYVSDNAPGVVDAVSLPDLRVRWSTTTGGRPGALLVTLDTVYVSLYESGQVVALDAATGAVEERRPVCAGPGQLGVAGGEVVAACGADGFALAVTDAGTWRGDYRSGLLVRDRDGARVQLSAHLHPFWLAAGPGGALYAAAEGDDEDHDPGAVVEVGADLAVRVLAAPRDPDQVEVAAGRVFAAAHGDHEVLAIDPVRRRVAGRFARGTDPVALAADLPLGLLVVVSNARE